MRLFCASFSDDGSMPARYTGFGEDISPELYIEDIPKATVSLAVTLDDLDVPLLRALNHWVIWNIPAASVIPEALPQGNVIETPVHACQGNAWGKHRYRGPKQPPFVKKEHRYCFTVYALDCVLGISTNSGKTALLKAMAGHVLSEARLVGRYKPE